MCWFAQSTICQLSYQEKPQISLAIYYYHMWWIFSNLMQLRYFFNRDQRILLRFKELPYTYTNRVSNKTKIKNDQQTIKRLVDSVKPDLRFQAIFVKLPYCHLIKISVDENWNFKMLKPPFYSIVFIFKHLYNLKNDQKTSKTINSQ